MSQQINLYDPALLKKRELLTLSSLTATAAALLLAMGAWGTAARAQVATLEGESLSLAPLVKALQERLVAIGKQAAEAKPDPRLEADLTAARELLVLRGDVIVALKKGVGGESASFAEYLRGFARQAPKGLWLTGFTISGGGASMEIRGRMTDPALLPQYIARLNGEKAFKGRAFAALKVSVGKPETQAGTGGAPGAKAAPSAASSAAQPTAVPAAPPFHEFTLIPATAPQSFETTREPQKLAEFLPPDTARAMEARR